MPQNPTHDEMEQIGNAIVTGNTIQAIKLYREFTGCGLAESKDFIETLRDELHSREPERFAARPVSQNPQVLVFWILWIAFLVSDTVIYIVLSKQPAHGQDLNPSFWMAGAAPVVLSTINRWMVLPRVQNVQAALQLLIFGFAFAELPLFLGLFLFPAHKEILFALSFAGILQYMPVFAGKLTR